MEPKVYIIVLNWNNWRDTLECLESVYRLEYRNCEIILCDNASTDGSVGQIERWAGGEVAACARSFDETIVALSNPPVAKPIDVLHLRPGDLFPSSRESRRRLCILSLDSNGGYASGNNAGIRLADTRGDVAFYWILNNDTVVAPNALGALVERAADPAIGMCGSLLLVYDDPQRVQAAAGAGYRRALAIPFNLAAGSERDDLPDTANIERAMAFVVGASMLVSAPFVAEVGLMREDYFLYFEELDWIMRAKDRFKLGFAPRSIVYHKEGATAGSTPDWRARSEISDLCAIRNRLLITRRYFPLYYPVVFATIVGVLLRRLARRQPGRALQVLRILANPGSYRLPLPASRGRSNDVG